MIRFLKSALFNFLYNMKLKNKFFITYSIIIFLPIFLLSFFVYRELLIKFNNQLLYSVKQGFNQTLISLENTIDRYDTLSLTISRSETFFQITSKVETEYPINKQQLDKANLGKEIYAAVSRTKTNGINIYFKNDFDYFTNNQDYFNIEQIESEAWYQVFDYNFNANRETLLLCPPSYFPENKEQEKQIVSFARAIVNTEKYNEYLGIIRIDLFESYFRTILDNNNSIPGSLSFIRTSEGEIFSSTDFQLMDNYQAYEIDKHLGTNEPWAQIKIYGKIYLVNSEPIGNYDCDLIMIAPYEEILAHSDKIRNIFIILVIVLILIILCIALCISLSMTNRISTVVKHMNLVKTGRLDLIDTPTTKDEIGKLVESYNYMINEMENLINMQYENGKKLKNAELNALQSQINPHFLYNTLDMINWMASNHMISEIRTSVISLAKFYKLSLSNGQEEITIGDEIMHVTMYMQLQNLRYRNQISFEVTVSDEIKNYNIVKTVLQPIVENSILHGIMEKPSKKGHILIVAKTLHEDIIIQITDNGVGMEMDTVNQLLKKKPSKKQGSQGGYGVYNVHKRIQYFYGASYGLKYTSQLGEGTVVEIKIPKVEL